MINATGSFPLLSFFLERRSREGKKAKGPSGVDSVLYCFLFFVFFFSFPPNKQKNKTCLSSFAVARSHSCHAATKEDISPLQVCVCVCLGIKMKCTSETGQRWAVLEKNKEFFCSSSAGLKIWQAQPAPSSEKAARYSPPPLPPERH